MGMTCEYVAVPARAADDATRWLGRDVELRPPASPDWVFLRAQGWGGPGLAVRRKGQRVLTPPPDPRNFGAEPFLWAACFDDDYAFVYGGAPHAEPWWLFINEDVAWEMQPGVFALAHARELMGDEDFRAEGARRCSAWSRNAPRRVDEERVLEIVGVDHLFANEGVDVLMRELELLGRRLAPATAFGQAVWVETGGFLIGPDGSQRFDLAKVRYVIGKGEDFFGVWDREAPLEPIARFETTGEGHRRARSHRAHLLFGLEPPTFE